MPQPRDLPNIHGFEFIGITSEGRRNCRVVRDAETSTCYVDGEAKYCDLSWWEHKKPEKTSDV